MNEPTRSHPLHLSTRSILKASAVALVIALVVLVVAVLPAEYGIDPTGLGRRLHLTQMNAAKEMQGSATSHVAEARMYQQNKVVLHFAPGEGFEYKFRMRPGQALLYSWSATGPLEYDLHGELENDRSGAFTSYEAKTDTSANGSFTASFEGVHGWHWQNNSVKSVTIALHTAGYYEVKGVIGAPDEVIVSSE
jgi:hypothetical protein